MNAIERLKKTGLSRGDIAKACKVTRQAVGFWERGRSMPTSGNMHALVQLARERGIELLASDFARPEPVVDH